MPSQAGFHLLIGDHGIQKSSADHAL